MGDKWLNTIKSADSGILRKAKPPHTAKNVEELLVFGYACKIFRDNERAKFIDHGKHLIPWMGDNTMKIDRYDVRANLTDLSIYEAPPGGYTNRIGDLTLAEQRAEQLCEEERYFSLYNNDLDEEMYQEDELKRLHQQRASSYGQVPFSYQDSSNTSSSIITPNTSSIETTASENNKDEENDEEFIPHPNFSIPPGIEIPQSAKLNVIIEKTAKFIAAQGAQMEILIKAKQSNNPQFEFLNQNNRLNRYYKHMLSAIKTGIYPSEEIQVPEEKVEQYDNNQQQQQPNQQQLSNQFGLIQNYDAPRLPVPTLKYKPSADCSYTQLISKIKGVPMALMDDFQSASNSPNSIDTNFTASSTTTNVTSAIIDSVYVPSVPPPQINTSIPVCTQKQPSPPPTTTSANVAKLSSGLLLTQYYNSDSENENEHEPENVVAEPTLSEAMPPPDIPIPSFDLQNIINKTALYVLKNGKEFEEILRTKNDARFSFLSSNDVYNRYYMFKINGAIVPAAMKKNYGATTTVMTKPSTVITGTSVAVTTKPSTVSIQSRFDKRPPSKLPPPTAISSATLSTPKPITSVSFSIKPKDVEPPINLRPALPQEPSSDEEDLLTKVVSNTTSVTNTTTLPTFPDNTRSVAISQSESMPSSTITAANRITVLENIELPALQLNGIGCTFTPVVTPATAAGPTTATLTQSIPAITTTIKSLSDIRTNKSITNTDSISSTSTDLTEVILRDSMLEDSTTNSLVTINHDSKQRDAKRVAEEKFKDRMAQVARDKLGSITREKQLQLERKKKAMAFLNQIKNGEQQMDIATILSKKINKISLPTTIETLPKVEVAEEVPTKVPSPSPCVPEKIIDVIPSSESDNESSVQSIHSSPNNNAEKLQQSLSQNVDEKKKENYIDERTVIIRSNSRSRSKSSRKDKRSSKKSKHRHSKKKSKKKSSRSQSDNDDNDGDRRRHRDDYYDDDDVNRYRSQSRERSGSSKHKRKHRRRHDDNDDDVRRSSSLSHKSSHKRSKRHDD